MKKGKKKKHEKRERELTALSEDSKDAPEAERAEENDPAADLPLRYAVQAIGGKWKARILWALRSGEPMRYGQVKQGISGITDMMLSSSLKELVSLELVERRQYKEIPPKVEYCLTPDGSEVIPIIRLMCDWAEKRMKKQREK